MRRRGAGVVAIGLASLVLLGAAGAERLGLAEPAPAAPGTARSWMWLCPHGGGRGWSGSVTITNPGTEESRVRLTTLGTGEPVGSGGLFTIPAGTQVVRRVPAAERGAATYVEVFDTWVSAAWMVEAGDPEHGLGAEPCAPEPATRAYTIESTTDRGESAYLIVMNPFEALAVVDVTLFPEGNPPVRAPEWTGIELRPRRSVALDIGEQVIGYDPVGTLVEAKLGRVAVSSLGLSEDGGVRSTLGVATTTDAVMLPVADSTTTTATVLVPGTEAILLNGELSTTAPPEAAGGLVAAHQQAPSAAPYPLVLAGPTTVGIAAEEGAFVAALRAAGEGADHASTAGTSAAAERWVVPPTVAAQPSFPGLVLTSPGDDDVKVTLTQLTGDGRGAVRSLVVPAGRTIEAPPTFMVRAPGASVLVDASGPIVALGASTSSGVRGISLYALALGVPVPDDVPVGP